MAKARAIARMQLPREIEEGRAMALVTCKECKQQISSDAASCPGCGKKQRRTSVVTWIVTVIVVLGMIGHFAGSSSNGGGYVAPANPASNMTLDWRWHSGGFGVVMVADFTVTNKNAFDVKDIEVTCKSYGASGTSLGSVDHTIYDVVKAGKTRKFKDVNVGFINSQASKANCEVTDVKQ